MLDLLETLKRYGRLFLVFPLLVALFVTGPKLYLELKAAGILEGAEPLTAIVIHKYRSKEPLVDEYSCGIQLKIADKKPREQISCDAWALINIGDEVERYDAWTVFVEKDEALVHAIIDAILLLIELGFVALFFFLPQFIDFNLKIVRESSKPSWQQPGKETP